MNNGNSVALQRFGLEEASFAPAGWYPCPTGRLGVLRWFDGADWTRLCWLDGSAPQVAGVVTSPPCNHLLHLLLTVATCGLWAPVWLIAACQRPRVAVIDNRGRVVATRTI